MKNMTFGLTLALLVSACSHKTESNAVLATPKFQIVSGDVSNVATQTITTVKTKRELGGLIVLLSSSRYYEFAQEHLNQKVQLLVGTNLLLETQMSPELAKGKLELSYSSLQEAQMFAELLMKK